MDSEDFVRLHWKILDKRWKDNDSYAPDLFLLDIGDKHFFDQDYKKVWDDAAKYTRELASEIARIQADIWWVQNARVIDTIQECDMDSKRRTLVRLQEILEQMKKGMK